MAAEPLLNSVQINRESFEFLPSNTKDAFTLSYDFLDNNNKNITSLSLINIELLKNEPFVRFASDYKHDHALMFDAVTTFAKALYQLKNSAYSIQSPVVSCSRSNRAVWKGGQIILNHIKNVSAHSKI